MRSSAPAKSAGDARYASQDPFIRWLSHTISTPNAISSAFFLRRTQLIIIPMYNYVLSIMYSNVPLLVSCLFTGCGIQIHGIFIRRETLTSLCSNFFGWFLFSRGCNCGCHFKALVEVFFKVKERSIEEYQIGKQC